MTDLSLLLSGQQDMPRPSDSKFPRTGYIKQNLFSNGKFQNEMVQIKQHDPLSQYTFADAATLCQWPDQRELTNLWGLLKMLLKTVRKLRSTFADSWGRPSLLKVVFNTRRFITEERIVKWHS